MSMTSSTGTAAVAHVEPHDAAKQIRHNLISASLGFALLLGITLITLFTPLLDGDLGGVGYGYIAGFLDFVVVLAIAAAHCRRANRLDAEVSG